MIYRVRTRSAREYLTRASEPLEAINAKSPWTRIVFQDMTTERMIYLKGDALESVEVMPETGP